MMLFKIILFQSAIALFGDGSLSTDQVDYGMAFTPDEKTAYVVRHNGKWGSQENPPSKIYRYIQKGDQWINTGYARFSNEDSPWSDSGIFISPDGKKAFFVSNRPYEGKQGDSDPDIFVTIKEGDEWGIPKPINTINSASYEASPVTDLKGNIYFTSIREGGKGLGDIYYSKLSEKEEYSKPNLMIGDMNSEFGEWNLIISSDGNWMIFESSGRPDGKSPYGDLYLTKKDNEGVWSEPKNFNQLNTTGSDLNPRILYKSKKLVWASSKNLENPGVDFYSIDLELILDGITISDNSIHFKHLKESLLEGKASTGGISLVDVDNDNDLDVYVSNGYDVSSVPAVAQKNRLYLNNGNGDFRLDEESVLSNDEMFSSGSTWGDFNNDGFTDVFISNQRSQHNALFANRGNGEFERITNSIVGQDAGHSYSANWSDIDNDGDLDLYVANGGISHKEVDFLYENNEDGTFSKIETTPITIDTLSTIGGLWRDFNGDNLPDLYASYRLQKDRIYYNLGDWKFEIYILEVPEAERYSFPKSSGTVGDIDNDGDLDIYQTSLMGGANFLFINDGKGNFEFSPKGQLTSSGGHTYGALFEDFNNDGDQDIIVANWGSGVHLFENKRGSFEQLTNTEMSSHIFYASTITAGDLDNDGRQDVIIPQWPNSKGAYERNEVFLNTSDVTGNWLKVKLTGVQSNRSGIGAKISIRCNSGDEVISLVKVVSSQQTWRSQGGLVQNFGLGNCSVADEVKVGWPSGLVTTIEGVSANQLIEVEE